MKILIKENQYKKLLETVSNDEDYIGRRVMVYYNLHKHTFSVTYNGRLLNHSDYVKLSDVEYSGVLDFDFNSQNAQMKVKVICDGDNYQ